MHACVIRGFHLRADATEPLSEEDIIQAALREEDVAGEEDDDEAEEGLPQAFVHAGQAVEAASTLVDYLSRMPQELEPEWVVYNLEMCREMLDQLIVSRPSAAVQSAITSFFEPREQADDMLDDDPGPSGSKP